MSLVKQCLIRVLRGHCPAGFTPFPGDLNEREQHLALTWRHAEEMMKKTKRLKLNEIEAKQSRCKYLSITEEKIKAIPVVQTTTSWTSCLSSLCTNQMDCISDKHKKTQVIGSTAIIAARHELDSRRQGDTNGEKVGICQNLLKDTLL